MAISKEVTCSFKDGKHTEEWTLCVREHSITISHPEIYLKFNYVNEMKPLYYEEMVSPSKNQNETIGTFESNIFTLVVIVRVDYSDKYDEESSINFGQSEYDIENMYGCIELQTTDMRDLITSIRVPYMLAKMLQTIGKESKVDI